MDKHARYRLNNQEKIKESNNKYYRENRDEICERKRKMYLQQKEIILPKLREKSECEHCHKLINSKYLNKHILRRHSEKNSCVS